MGLSPRQRPIDIPPPYGYLLVVSLATKHWLGVIPTPYTNIFHFPYETMNNNEALTRYINEFTVVYVCIYNEWDF